jgi:hypothetical protein
MRSERLWLTAERLEALHFNPLRLALHQLSLRDKIIDRW